LGEVGKNMTACEYGGDILIVDAGIMFPENDMLGIDYIIPDFDYLLDKANRVRGIVITHGHEDHIGAVRHVLLVGIIKSRRQHGQDTADHTQRHLPTAFVDAFQIGGQRRAVDVFHHNVRPIVKHIVIIDLDDVGMAQASRHARLALEALEQIRVLFEVAVQKFYRHRAL